MTQRLWLANSDLYATNLAIRPSASLRDYFGLVVASISVEADDSILGSFQAPSSLKFFAYRHLGSCPSEGPSLSLILKSA